MMLSTTSSGLIGNNSAEAAVGAVTEAAHDSGGGESGEVGGGGTIPGGGFSEDDKARIEEGERAVGGNRWPRQETLALLKIRSEMDVAFKDSSLKGPLWEEVSRKMAELGFQRSSKKCKEKFENVFKYHKRTKEGRASKSDGKTYRFFDQLEALETNPSLQLPPTPTPRPPPLAASVQMATVSNLPISSSHVTVSSPLSPNPVSFAQNLITANVVNPITIPSLSSLQPPPTTNAMNPQTAQPSPYPQSHSNIMASMLSNSSSSSTSSDEEIGRRQMRKRKWKDFFERLMKDVIVKQEELQKKFLDSLEKRERDRMIREEAWRVQEMARMNREHDLLVQERSMAAAKDAAVIAFLQKITDQQNPNGSSNAIQIPVQLQLPNKHPLPPAATAPSQAAVVAPPPSMSISIPPQPTVVPVQQQTLATPIAAAPAAAIPISAPSRNLETPKISTDNGIQNFIQPSSSRWPKSEVQALINLRTNLDTKYQENGPKGPLWEEISSGMRKLGYNRNSKRCKEKWENINKYFKKVKEGSKKRPEDSKTCPYFHQLDALYKEKAKMDTSSYTFGSSGTNAVKPENPMVPIMARPEQQWPLQQEQHQQQQQQQDSAVEDHESDNMDENDHDHDDDGDDEDDDEGGGYEIVTNKQPSSVATTVE